MVSSRTADVLIVGGGPAGSSTAIRLARSGVRVVLLERARFPRAKPCAECLSPQASRPLQELGVLPGLERQGTWLRGMLVRAPDGGWARGDYVAGHSYRAPRASGGLSIRREVLDATLLAAASAAGADVREASRVTDVVRTRRGAAAGAVVIGADGRRHEVRARIVIGADGLRSVVARRLELARALSWPHRIALVAHYRGVAGVGEYVEMHVERDGFVGIADVGLGCTTVAAVFPRRRAREIAGNRAGFLDAWLASRPQLRARFAGAVRDGGVAATGPFAARARRAWHPGALLVGDAADFFDPFTGEGIYAALRGGELAADAALAALAAGQPDDPLREYDRLRRREFAGKWRVEQMIGAGVAWPAVVNRAVAALGARKDMADLLAGVTGDFVPPREVLRLGFLARLFLLPIRASAPHHSSSWP